MGNCVAREIGFGVETRARNDALVKKIQERLEHKRTTRRATERADNFSKDDQYQEFYLSGDEFVSEGEEPLQFRNKKTSDSKKTSNRGTYRGKDKLPLSIDVSPESKDHTTKNKEYLQGFSESAGATKSNSSASVTTAEQRFARSKKNFFSSEEEEKREHGEGHKETEKQFPEPKEIEFSPLQKETGQKQKKKETEWDFESKDPAQKRETWDTTNSSALQRLHRFKENKPFDFPKPKKEFIVDDVPTKGRTKSPNKIDLFNDIDKVDFSEQIKSYTQKSVAYQGSMSTGPRIIGFENEFFKDQITDHVNEKTPPSDGKYNHVFPEGFDSENTD